LQNAKKKQEKKNNGSLSLDTGGWPLGC
jgi:hypothetical protein